VSERGRRRDYDLEYTVPEGSPVQRRLGIDVDHGTVTRFVVRLVYPVDTERGRWAVVVR
jgi:hypothetical protein